MPSTLKTAGEKGVGETPGFIGGGVQSAKAEDVGVVVLSGEGSLILVAGEAGADTIDFVRGNAHPDTGCAAEDASLSVPLKDITADLLGKVGIIDRFRGPRTAVDDLMPRLGQMFKEGFPQRESPVIATDTDFHFSKPDLNW